MKTCSYCGQSCEDGVKFCPSCGAGFPVLPQPGEGALDPVQGSAAVPNWTGSAYASAPRANTKAEFLRLPENEKLKKNLRASGIFCYISAGITAALGVVALQNPYILIDVAIVLVLGLLIHLKQSRAAAVLLLVYAGLNTIVNLMNTGRVGGYLVILAAIYAVISTFQLEKQWKEYRTKHGM